MKTQVPKGTNQNKGNLSRYIFSTLASIFFIGVIVQVFLAGMAAFVNVGNWYAHIVFVRFIEYIPLVMVIFAFTGKLSKWFRWNSLFLYLLIFIQYITATLTSKIGILAALHPVIAMILFWLSLTIMRRSFKYLK